MNLYLTIEFRHQHDLLILTLKNMFDYFNNFC